MKLNIKAESIFYFIVILLFIAFCAALLLYISGRSSRDKIMIEYNTERLLKQLIEAYYEGTLDDEFKALTYANAFGLYDKKGYLLIKAGSAPLKLDFEGEIRLGGNYYYDKKAKTLTMLAPVVGIHKRMAMMKMQRMMHRNLLVGYLNINSSEYFKRGILYRLIFVVVPLLFLVMISLLIVFYNKNLGYRKKIASQEQLVRLGQVSRTLAHEIKNPLGAIKIQTGYLKKVLPPENRQDLEVIDEEIERLNMLTTKIGDFLRDPIGQQEQIDVAAFMSSIIERYKYDIRLLNNVPEHTYITFDRHRLESVMLNIIINGIESMTEQPEQQLTIRITAEEVGTALYFTDTGVGLPTDSDDKLFDPFYTGKIKGTGLGLAISKRFVEAAGGTIAIYPAKDKGTEVRLFFKSTYKSTIKGTNRS